MFINNLISLFISHFLKSIFVKVESKSNETIITNVIYKPKTSPKADVNVFVLNVADVNDVISTVNTCFSNFNIHLLNFDTSDKTMSFKNIMFL